MIRLDCSDGPLHTSRDVVQCSALIKDMLNDLEIKEDCSQIPLQEVATSTMKEIIDWCKHHGEVVPQPHLGDDTSVKREDQAFFEHLLDVEILDIIYASNYLEIELLLDASCKEAAKRGRDNVVDSDASRVYRIPELNERISLEESRERRETLRRSLPERKLQMYEECKTKGVINASFEIDSGAIWSGESGERLAPKKIQISQDLRKKKALVDKEIAHLEICARWDGRIPLEMALGSGVGVPRSISGNTLAPHAVYQSCGVL